MTSYWFALLTAVAVIAGGALVALRYEWARRNSARLTSLAAGVLVSLGLIEVIPEAVEHAPRAGLWIAAGFLLMYALENLFSHPHCAEDELPHHQLSFVVYVAVLLHSIIDGVSLSASFRVSEEFGMLVGVGVLLHKIPEGLAVGALLLHMGFSSKAIFALTSALGVTVYLAAIFSAEIFSAYHDSGIPFIVLAVVGGSFLYVGVADLLTHSHREKDRSIIALFLIGFAIFFLRHLLGGHHG